MRPLVVSAVVALSACATTPPPPPPAPAPPAAAEPAAAAVGGLTVAPGGPVLRAVQPTLPRKQAMALLISDVQNDPRYKPTLPPALNKDGMIVKGLFRICVDREGRVFRVEVVKSADRLVDQAWVEKLRTWQYRPYLIDGRPVPFCYPLHLAVQALAEPPVPAVNGPPAPDKKLP
jgi:protein TonB